VTHQPTGADDLPVVLLHGAPGGAHDWQRVVPLLNDCTVLAPDRPGYRPGFDCGAGGFFDNARWLVDLLDRHELARVVVAGYSWGGGAALATALIAPDRVGALALIGSVGTRSAVSAGDRVVAWPGVGAAVSAVMHRWGPAWANRVARGSGSRLDTKQIASLDASLSAMSSGPAWSSWLVEQRALIKESPALDDALSQIDVPAVLLSGAQDTVVPPAACRDLARRLPKARLREVAAGHLLPLEAPQAVAEAIREAMALRASSTAASRG